MKSIAEAEAKLVDCRLCMQACKAYLFIQVLVLRSVVTCELSKISCQSQDMHQFMHVKPR